MDRPDEGQAVEAPSVGVSELLLAVRRELAGVDYRLRAAGVPALLKLETVEVEVSFTASRRTEGTGGVDLKVITAGASRAREFGEVQVVRIQYTVDPEAVLASIPGVRGHRAADAGDATDVGPL